MSLKTMKTSNTAQTGQLDQSDNVRLIVFCVMKLANILCSLQSYASTHPCKWCDIDSRNLSKKGNLLTFGNLRVWFAAFKNAGEDLKKTKLLKNIIHEPLL